VIEKRLQSDQPGTLSCCWVARERTNSCTVFPSCWMDHSVMTCQSVPVWFHVFISTWHIWLRKIGKAPKASPCFLWATKFSNTNNLFYRCFWVWSQKILNSQLNSRRPGNIVSNRSEIIHHCYFPRSQKRLGFIAQAIECMSHDWHLKVKLRDMQLHEHWKL